LAKKGEKSSKAEREAGRRNLMKWKQENPDLAWQTNLRHGVYSKNIKNRYSDPNTPEGKSLQAILQAIEKDIGKPFDARQTILMGLIRSKLVIVMQVARYLESTSEIVDYDLGQVPPVVDKTFFTASNSLRNALNELYASANNKKSGEKTYEEIVQEMKNRSRER
jgi:hypothetical protein